MDVVIYEKTIRDKILNTSGPASAAQAQGQSSGMASSRNSLQNKLGELGRCIYEVAKDGHCIPNSIASFLRIERNEEYTCQGILNKLRNEFDKNMDYFTDYGLTEDEIETQLDAYIDEKKFNTDIGDMILPAIATMLRVKVTRIICDINDLVTEDTIPPLPGVDSTRTVYLLSRGGTTTHYDALILVTEQMKHFKDEIRRLEKENKRGSTAKTRQDLEDMKNAQSKLNQDLKDAQTRVDNERQAKEKLAEDKRKLNEEININKAKLADMEEKCGNMQGDRDKIRIEKDKLSSENEELKRKLQEMENEKRKSEEQKPSADAPNTSGAGDAPNTSGAYVPPDDLDEDEEEEEDDEADWGTLTLTPCPEGLVVGEGGVPGTDIRVDDVITGIGDVTLVDKSAQEAWQILQDNLTDGNLEFSITRN